MKTLVVSNIQHHMWIHTWEPWKKYKTGKKYHFSIWSFSTYILMSKISLWKQLTHNFSIIFERINHTQTPANTEDLWQGDRILGRGEALWNLVVANGGPEAAECDVRRDFGGDKGAALGTRQTWKRQGRQVRSGVWYRERRASVLCNRYRWRPGGRIILCGCTTEGNRKRERAWAGIPPGKTSGGGQKKGGAG